jgi:coenzyme F420-reducing hydrogenase beta subunit
MRFYQIYGNEKKMKTVCKYNECSGCMACVEKCPKKCITIDDSMFSLNAIKDTDVCVSCGICERICPQINVVKKRKPIMWFQGWAKDKNTNSSSGGAASSIMSGFIENGGYVASCVFKSGGFQFYITNDNSSIDLFAGSKYVKSNPSGIYQKIQEKLKTDKVLFVGLPCQVAGLLNYIKISDSNLYTIDLICHGTPSPKLLERFFQDNNVELNKISDIKFRQRTSFGIIVNNKKICSDGLDDYLIAFLQSSSFTENCYSCPYASLERVSDVTLGDSWGTDLKEDIKNGVSLVLVNSDKGKKLLEDSDMILKGVNLDMAVSNNAQLIGPSKKPSRRHLFINALQNGKSFAYATYIIDKRTYIKKKIKRLLKQLGFIT